jgi:hypothetical protein
MLQHFQAPCFISCNPLLTKPVMTTFIQRGPDDHEIFGDLRGAFPSLAMRKGEMLNMS